MRTLRDLDQRLVRLKRVNIIALAAVGVVIVGGIDYITGYEISFSLFYLGPVALATWYAGRREGTAIAVLSGIAWYLASTVAGAQFSHPGIAVWNTLVRLAFFLVTCMLLSALRRSLLSERQLARMDVLTELHSRRAFEERLAHDLALAQRHRSALSLVYLDLDGFKAVNDTRGHAEGDRVLRTIGRALRQSTRDADTAARLGGDEFALVLPDTDRNGAERIVAKVRNVIAKALEGWPVTCSIGVATFVDPAISATNAIAAADALMYEVKRDGKNAVAYRVLGERGRHADAAGA